MAKNLRIKAARAALDMTAIEKGDYNPTVKLCIKICKVLNKSLDELFWEDILDEEI